jgi:6,7-dimethyl-8-ribityllumazine synthase
MSQHSSVAADRQRKIEGERLARGMRVAIVAARFNDFIVEPLLNGAVQLLQKHGAEQRAIKVVHVPGAFELPLVAQKLAKSRHYDAVIALGAVLRGDTPHFDYVAGECAAGLLRVSLDTGVPVIFGVLTTDTVEQATDRAGGKHGNKGADAALTAIEMVALLRSLDS